MPIRHRERHRTERIGWLRAAVLGANDGIISTASLVVGVAAADATHSNVLVAGVAGLVAGAMSMAAGEYVSVHSQADTEQAELQRERTELKADDKGEHEELMEIYIGRALDPSLAKQVAAQLMTRDALGAHARDECVGLQLRCWSRHASLGHRHSPRCESDSPYLRNVTGMPRAPGWGGGVRGRCTGGGGRHARHILGCSGHGADRRRRSAVRNRCVSEATRR
jgi:hypothetical protein